MFLGEYVHTLDSKGRLTVPARYRAELDSGLVITRGYQECLAVYPQEEWMKLAIRLAQIPSTSTEAIAYSQIVFGGASEVSLDSAGRILVPAFLREYAGLSEQAVLVGANTYFQVWEPDRWREQMALNRQNWGAILAEMARRGL